MNIQQFRAEQLLKLYGVEPKTEQLQKSELQEELIPSKYESPIEVDQIEKYRDLLQKSSIQKALFSTLEGKERTFEIIKAIGRAGLTAKKVTIHAKDGSIHQAIRWIHEGSDNSPEVTHKQFNGVKDTHVGNNFDEKIKHSLHESGKSPVDQAKDLIHQGVYDKALISKITGADPQQVYDLLYYGGVKNKEFKDEHEGLKVETGEKVPVGGKKLDISTTLSDAKELLSGKDLKQFTKDRKASLAEKHGITVQDRWDSYELGVMQVIRLGTPKSLLAFGTGGVGKAVSLDTKVLTPYGFKEMRDIKYGDIVSTPENKEAKVVGVYPQGFRPTYLVTFKDGRTVKCDLDHLWKVKDRTSDYSWRVLPLSEIVKSGLRKSETEYRFGVPIISQPFQYKQRTNIGLRVNPWLLGYLLGDGGLTQTITFTVGHRDRDFILNKLNTEILNLEEQRVKVVQENEGCTEYTILGYKEGKKNINPLQRELTKLGIMGKNTYNKSIPESYFKMDYNYRLELVRGLMDSDGYVDDNGTCIYTSVSKELAEGFHKLVCGLGARFAKIVHDDGNVKNGTGVRYYDVTFLFPADLIPVTLPFKVERIQKLKKHPIDSLSIIDVKYIGEEELQCIKIDTLDGLFVVNDFIVTHNTYTLSNKDQKGVIDRLGLEKFDIDIHDPSQSGQWDWAEIGGAMSKTEIWKTLYANKDKLVVFDDCDSQWDDENMVNILKKILDSSGDGLVSYSGSTVKDDTGQKITQFKFTGKVVFISNLTREDLVKKGAGPIVSSRSMAIDLTMSREETLTRITDLAERVTIRDNIGNVVPVGKEEREMALEVMSEFINDIGEDQLNVRVFNNLASKAYFLKQMGRLDRKTFWKESVMQLL